jgi:hypothetical protein
MLEVLVALALSVILTAIGVVNHSQLRQSFDRNNTLKTLESDLRRAKARALVEGARGIIEFSASSYSFGIDYQPYSIPAEFAQAEFLRNLPGSVLIESDPIIFDSRGYLVDELGDLVTRDILLFQRGTLFLAVRIFPTGTLVKL